MATKAMDAPVVMDANAAAQTSKLIFDLRTQNTALAVAVNELEHENNRLRARLAVVETRDQGA